MIDIQWGTFRLYAEGVVATLLLGIPLVLLLQLPTIQRILRAISRRARSARLASDIAYRIRQTERMIR